jgi:hypothetical protein
MAPRTRAGKLFRQETVGTGKRKLYLETNFLVLARIVRNMVIAP